MIVVDLSGGLGNQMFQYACGLSMSLESGLPLYFCIDGLNLYRTPRELELESAFGINLNYASYEILKSIIGPWRCGTNIRRILAKKIFRHFRSRKFISDIGYGFISDLPKLISQGGYLHGYWQCERYFVSYSNIIRDTFRFRTPLDPKNYALANRIAAGPSIGLHVRRGDILSNPHVLAIHGICELDYYREAIKRLRSFHPEARLFVISDDPAWVSKTILTEFGNSECVCHNNGSVSFRDMQMFSLCNHQIVANSSFSWWGAWLNSYPNKRVIGPRRWFANVSLNSRFRLPSEWEAI